MQWSRCLLSLELCAARPTYQHPPSQACCYDGSTERGLPPGPITGRIPKLSPLAASHILPPLTPLFLPCRYREPWLSATFFHAATYWMLENRETLLLRMGFCKVLDLSDAFNGYLRSLARYAAHLTRRKEWCGTVPIRWRPSVGNQRYNHPRTTPPEHRLRGLGPRGSRPAPEHPPRPPSHGLRAPPRPPPPPPPAPPPPRAGCFFSPLPRVSRPNAVPDARIRAASIPLSLWRRLNLARRTATPFGTAESCES